MAKNDNSLLDLEKKLGNEKNYVLNKYKFNKPDMNINNLNNNSKFNRDNLLLFLNNFKKENDKIMNDTNKQKYNIEIKNEDEEEEQEEESIKKGIELNEDDENEVKEKKEKKEEIELDLLMGILEQQKKKEISIEDIIDNDNIKKGNAENNNIENIINRKYKGEKEIMDFFQEKNKK